MAIYFRGNDCDGDGDVHYFFLFQFGEVRSFGCAYWVWLIKELLKDCIGLAIIMLMGVDQYIQGTR